MKNHSPWSYSTRRAQRSHLALHRASVAYLSSDLSFAVRFRSGFSVMVEMTTKNSLIKRSCCASIRWRGLPFTRVLQWRPGMGDYSQILCHKRFNFIRLPKKGFWCLMKQARAYYFGVYKLLTRNLSRNLRASLNKNRNHCRPPLAGVPLDQ